MTAGKLFATVLTTVVVLLVGAAAAAASTIPFRGANMHLWTSGGYDTAAIDRDLDVLADLGSTSLRLDVSWDGFEPKARGQYDAGYLALVDRVVSGATARGIKPLLTVWATPCWASSAPETLKQSCTGAYWDRDVTRYAPKNTADFGAAAAFVAKRYEGKLAGVELWNEPNFPDFLKAGDGVESATSRATAYAAMVKAAYPMVKAAAPSTTVVAGAIEGTDVPFLDALYALGLKGNYDVLAVHPYNGPRNPYHVLEPGWDLRYDFRGGLPRMRERMVANGDAAKAMWLSEFGYATCTDGDYSCVDATTAGKGYKDALKLLTTPEPAASPVIGDMSYVTGVFLYEVRNSRDSTCRECQYGIVNRDFTRKEPLYTNVKEAFAAAGVPTPTEPAPSEPTPTEPAPTEPAPTEPTPPPTTTEPEPTPPPTTTKPSKGGGGGGSCVTSTSKFSTVRKTTSKKAWSTTSKKAKAAAAKKAAAKKKAAKKPKKAKKKASKKRTRTTTFARGCK